MSLTLWSWTTRRKGGHLWFINKQLLAGTSTYFCTWTTSQFPKSMRFWSTTMNSLGYIWSTWAPRMDATLMDKQLKLSARKGFNTETSWNSETARPHLSLSRANRRKQRKSAKTQMANELISARPTTSCRMETHLCCLMCLTTRTRWRSKTDSLAKSSKSSTYSAEILSPKKQTKK